MVERKKVTSHESEDDEDSIHPISDLRREDRRICIVTTAALPWRTGTSVNPLARALYLTRGRPKHHVTFLIPWLDSTEVQSKLFGTEDTFDSEKSQEKWIREYCRNRMDCETEAENLQIQFYPAFYHEGFGSIFPTVDICAMIPDDEADIAILEEPEHLNWLRVPPDSKEEKSMLGWQSKFNFVVGIMHTNYRSYAEQSGLATSLIGAPALASLSSMVVRAYCHRVIRLSATLPVLDQEREKTCNVHGVRSEFFEEPEDTNCDVTEPSAIYFIGKLVWAKGFDKLLEMEDLFKQTWGEYFQIDIYGSGNDKDSIQRAFFGRRGIVDMGDGTSNQDEEVNDSVLDRSAAQLFGATGSLRDQLQPEGGSEEPPGQRTRIERTCEPDPLQILGELSGKSIETSLSTTAAVGDICKQATYFGFHGTFSEYSKEDDSSKGYRLDLPKSKFEFRRHPIPARFLGTKDHAVIKNIPSHRIFLNLSESEVLCTTTAEALAMGKWVIIPEHPSNTFFVQFSNCLAFSSKEDCIEKIRHALSNDPQPLSKEAATMLSWEGANNRLFDAALMTRTEYEERENSKDKDLANLHIHSSKYLHSFQSAVMTTFNF